ncbi:hypothetical protein OG607_00495 [Streptomyces sp. NBC_01537]|uniref:hypothetical protein n=1 Tax=Streptomyces sp. NBC_01537 TaxID=2903896 RepID=UPI003870576E
MSTWVDFYGTLASVAAGIAAIAFLTFQVRADVWREGTTLRRLLAVFTLAEFGTPLFTALIILMPSHPWRLAAGIVGLVGLVLVAVYWTAYVSARFTVAPQSDEEGGDQGTGLSSNDHWQAILTTIPLGGYGGFVWLAIAHPTYGPETQAWICLWFLLSRSVEAWWFLKAPTASRGTRDDELTQTQNPVSERP